MIIEKKMQNSSMIEKASLIKINKKRCKKDGKRVLYSRHYLSSFQFFLVLRLKHTILLNGPFKWMADQKDRVDRKEE